ncbi:GerMN domain-containing protein [Capillibacterium thermochitinicola]|uniref:GerMN domain-containing protein n=1 Tax=Capillibacterium thermochitinicola TaxID=2699427 RepID=A0A8J6I009_9FIRM|nr:GerMN domain-containing protein [Capillibacterium thermochitinicola]MBA2133080.1 GerMN domain-containing protein [Capillibacterium thermochitinicola]
MRKTGSLVGVLLVLALLFVLFISPGYLRRAANPPDSPQLPEEPAPTEREREVTLYFPNQEYIQTGRSDLPMLKTVTRKIKATDENLVVKVLAELRNPPTEEGLTTALQDKLKILSAWQDGRRAYVDFSSENLSGGSLQETLLVHQIVKTLTGLPGIEEVQFLVDGEKRESLMGHIATDEPLGAERL